MRENRTTIILIVLCVGLIFGWPRFLDWVWPPARQPRPDLAKKDAETLARVEPLHWAQAVPIAAAVVSPGLPALATAAEVATSSYLTSPVAQARLERELIRQIVEQVATPSPGVSGPLRAGLLVSRTQAARADVRQLIIRELAQRNRQARAVAARREITLGDDESNLKVVLTTLGGGVRDVMLNQFAAANRHGLREPGPLHLVRGEDEQGRLRPAFQLFHYAPGADDPNTRPLNTLGELDWTLRDDSIKKTRLDEGTDRARDIITEVTFTAEVPGQDVLISKTYTLSPDDYHMGLTVRLERTSGAAQAAPFRYQLAGGHGLPIEGEWYTTTFRTTLVGQVDGRNGLWRDYQDSRTISIEQGGERVDKNEDKLIRYAAVAVQYFASAIVVDNTQKDQDFLQWARPTLPWTGYQTSENRPQLDNITIRVNTRPLDLKPEAPVEHRYLLYHGPMKVALLRELGGGGKTVSDELIHRYRETLRLDTLTDYHYQMPGFPGAMSRFFSAIYWTNVLIACTNLMHWVLGGLHVVIPNYGVCILLLTLVVRLAMFPISRKQALMSVRMQALGPEMKKVQEKHKDDPQARQQAMMELYRKHGVNPLGSCWVMLLQMPIFMGLYYALQESIHFRLADFLWIKNLAAPDMLYYWGEGVPWINRPQDQGGFLYLGPYFNILPLIAVGLMVVHQKLFTPPPADEQQAMQMKMMKYMMLFMGLFFYKVAAGLALYFIVSSLWGLAERRFLPKAKSAEQAAQQAAKSAKTFPSKVKAKPEKQNGKLQKVQDWWEEVLRQAKKK